VTLKTGVMMLKIQLLITRINYILKHIQIGLKKKKNHIIAVFLFYQINAALVAFLKN